MVDQPDDLGTNEPQPTPPPDDVLEPEPEFLDDPGDEPVPPTDEHLAPSAPLATSDPSVPVENKEPLPAVPPPAARPVPEGPRRPVFPIVLGLILIGVLVVAVMYGPQLSKSLGIEPATATANPAPPPAKSPLDDLTEQVQSLQGKVDGLAAQTQALQERVEKQPRPAPATDLKPLQDRLDNLARTSEELAPLPGKVRDLDTRLDSMDQALASLRDDIGALRDEVKQVGERAAQPEQPSVETPAPRPADVNLAGQGLEEGVQLFKANQYKEASDVFHRLTEEFPKDARVWYYAALSNGLATKQWRGETERLVNEGMEREKAGSPEKDRIDAAFNDLPTSLKTWLDAYRSRITR